MKKKGFTIVELLTVVTILVVIMLIAVPGYRLIVDAINNHLLESKKQSAQVSAEKYASNNGVSAVTPKILIETGNLEADNESGEYRNPVTKEDMSCNIITVLPDENGNIYGKFTDETNCTRDQEELSRNYSNIEIIKSDINGNTITDKWTNISPVILSYRFKNSLSYLESSVKGQRWTGEEETTGKTKEVRATRLKTGIYTVVVETEQNGITAYHTASTELNMDLEQPVIESITVDPADIYVRGTKKVTVVANDGNGSGVYGYYISENANNCSNFKSDYTPSGREFSVQLGEGNYGVCVIDNVGNISSKGTFIVDKIDNDPPVITNFQVDSKEPDFNSKDTIVSLGVEEEHGPIKVQISVDGGENTGWLDYQTSYDLTMPGDYDGNQRTIHVTVEDGVGNQSNSTTTYTMYKQCTDTRVDFEVTGECSNQCGNGEEPGINHTKDIHTDYECQTDLDVKRACTENKGCQPSCTLTKTGPKGTNAQGVETDWFLGSVNLTLNMDDGSNSEVQAAPITSFGIKKKGTADYTNVSSMTVNENSTGGIRYYGFVKNEYGVRSTCQIVVKIDTELPTCTVNKSTTKADESTSGVSASFECTDNFSGVKKCVQDKDGLKSSKTYTIRDKAGNTNDCTINISNETQYRKQTCSKCNEHCTSSKYCQHADCGQEQYVSGHYSCSPCSYTSWSCGAWRNSGTGCTAYQYDTSKRECSGNGLMVQMRDCSRSYVCSTCESHSWRNKWCNTAACGCASWAESCPNDGCASWGSLGNWNKNNACTATAKNNNECKDESRIIYW